MNGASRLGTGVFLALSAAAIAFGCGSSDESTGDGSGGGTPGCTKEPDCNSCGTCPAACKCLGGTDAECATACGSTGGSAGVGGTGTGGSGTGGSGTGGSGTGGSGAGGVGGTPTAGQCFADINDGLIVVNYDQFNPKIGSHCNGTNHQDIQGVERFVFLGDSIMNGTPPTPAQDFARTRMEQALAAKFPGAEVGNCSENGARNDDFLMGGNQIPRCFPTTPDTRKTLTVIIMGGNDLASVAKDKPPLATALAEMDVMLKNIRDAVTWLKDPGNFPNGSYVVFANVYEYTDTSADLNSCPLAGVAGFNGQYLDAAAVLVKINEGYMKLATDTQSDMVFMMEDFCGHGYRASDPNLQCYRGPGAENWFDFTCIHPTPTGHGEIADAFMDTINE